jgi:hypothetical protein
MSQFRFVPLRGMCWSDFLLWVDQCAPECYAFLNSVSGSLCSIFSRELPQAFIENENEPRPVVKLVWLREGMTFTLSVRNSLGTSKFVDVEWSVSDKKGSSVVSGRSERSTWLSFKLINDFVFYWARADEGRQMMLQISFATFVIFSILASLSLFV